jgi:UDP-4-amino-4,6-dideoxy-N-acetyl-beta-L-altrosamine transaminase
MIPYGSHSISQDDINQVVDVLKHKFITQGDQVPLFEKNLSSYAGAKFVSVVNSATSALHLAYLSLGVGPKDIVWTSPITFVATSNAALMCGAIIDFVDIEESTLNMSISALKEKLIKAEKEKLLPKVITPVHMCGNSCDMKEIYSLSKKYGFKIIEDASHAIGGEYLNKKIGNCEFSDIAIFSFHPVKIITSGEGGALLTNCEKINKKVKLLRSHGTTKKNLSNLNEGPWYYEQHSLGYNYRMTDIQSALGLNQLKRVDQFVKKRNQIAQEYNNFFDLNKINYIKQNKDSYSAYHLFIIKVNPSTRLDIFNQLQEQNIGVQVHYYPVHLQPFYKKLGFTTGMFPVAESIYKTIISIPIYFDLDKDKIKFIQEKILCNIKSFEVTENLNNNDLKVNN